jgi:acetyl esterase/lipase
MPSKQSEAVRRRWEASRLAMVQPGFEALLGDHARKAGVDVRLDIFPDMLHTFQMAAGRAPEADDAIRELAGWVRPQLGL